MSDEREETILATTVGEIVSTMTSSLGRACDDLKKLALQLPGPQSRTNLENAFESIKANIDEILKVKQYGALPGLVKSLRGE